VEEGATFCENCGCDLAEDLAETEANPPAPRKAPAREEPGHIEKPREKSRSDASLKLTSHCPDLDVRYNVNRIFVEGLVLPFEFRVTPGVEGITDLCLEIEARKGHKISEHPPEYPVRGEEIHVPVAFQSPAGLHGKVPFRIYVGYKRNGTPHWFTATNSHKVFRAREKAQKVIDTLVLDLKNEAAQGHAGDIQIHQRIDNLEALRPREDNPAADLKNVDLPPAWAPLNLRRCRRKLDREAPGLRKQALPAPPDAARQSGVTLSIGDCRVHFLAESKVTLGRSRDCDVVTRITRSDGREPRDPNLRIGRYHCRIEMDRRTCKVVDRAWYPDKKEDRTSTCGIFVDNHRVSPGGQTFPANQKCTLSLTGPDARDKNTFGFEITCMTCAFVCNTLSPCFERDDPAALACVSMKRCDSVKERIVLLRSCCRLSTLDAAWGDVLIRRLDGAFSAQTPAGHEWLTPGRMVGLLPGLAATVQEYKQARH